MRIIILLIAYLSAASCVFSTENGELDYSSYYAKGVRLYNIRAKINNGSHADQINIDNAIKYFKTAIMNNKQERLSTIYLLKSYEFKGNYTLISDNDKKYLFADGKELGENMMRKFPNDPEIKYWYMINLGRWAETQGVVKSAKAGVAGDIKEMCEDLIKANPYYNDAGAYRVLGGMYLKVPYIPFILTWPSDEKAVEMLSKANNLAPTNIANKLIYAEALYENKDKDKAIAILTSIISTTPRNDKYLEDKRVINQAKELLKNFS